MVEGEWVWVGIEVDRISDMGGREIIVAGMEENDGIDEEREEEVKEEGRYDDEEGVGWEVGKG